MPRRRSGHRPSASQPGARSAPYDYLIVGAGFAGSVLAERLASDRASGCFFATAGPISPATPLIATTRPASWSTNTARTSSTPTARRSFAYLSRFTHWRPYEHRVLASVGDKLLPMPINRTTLNGLFGLDLQDDEAAAAVPGRPRRAGGRDPHRRATSSSRRSARISTGPSSKAIRASSGGSIPRSSTSRSRRASRPARRPTTAISSTPSRRCRPTASRGCSRTCSITRTSASRPASIIAICGEDELAPHTIFTGPIDDYFDHRFGPLPYRSLDFRHETLDVRSSSSRSRVVNYPSEDVPLHAHHRIQASDRPEPPEDQHLATNLPVPTAIPIIRFRGRKTRRSTSNTRRLRAARDNVTSSGGSAPTSITTWIRSSGRRWRPSAASRNGMRPARVCRRRMSEVALIVLATDSAEPSGVGEHMLDARRARSEPTVGYHNSPVDRGQAPVCCRRSCALRILSIKLSEDAWRILRSGWPRSSIDQFCTFMRESDGRDTASSPRQEGICHPDHPHRPSAISAHRS